MAKQNKCCFSCLITAIVLSVAIFVTGYFGGNYLFKRYIGDNGELYQLGINNWGDLFRKIGEIEGLKGAPDMEEENTANEENLTSAQEALEDSLVGYTAGDDFFESSFVFKSTLYLTGGQLASLVDAQFEQLATEAGIDMGIAQIVLDNQEDGSCVITVTMRINTESFAEQLTESLGSFKSLADSILKEDYIYLTSTNRIISTDGVLSLDTEYSGEAFYIGNDPNNEMNILILDIITSSAGEDSNDSLSESFGNIICEAVNGIGSASFITYETKDVIAIDNKYNNGLIYSITEQENICVNTDISQYYAGMNQTNITSLIEIKADIESILINLARTQYTATSTPSTDALVVYVTSVKTEFDVMKTAYDANPLTVDLNNLTASVNDLYGVLGIS